MSDTLDHNHDPSEFDALAELFLGDNGASAPKAPRPAAPDLSVNGHHTDVVGSIGLAEPPAPAPRAKAFIEALVIGHLPVRTGPWLSQYASNVAKADHEPVALLRIAESEVRIDLVGGSAPERPSLQATLEEAIELAASRTGRWMVQVGDLDVPSLLNSPLVDAITLLAGGNEAALVDAYRTIKTLVAGTPAETTDDAERPKAVPAIRLAIMGADEDRARTVADRLRDASRAFLGREIELAAGIREMGPTNAAPLFRGPTTLDIRAILDGLRHGSRSKPTPKARTPEPAPQAPEPVIAPTEREVPRHAPAPSIAAPAADRSVETARTPARAESGFEPLSAHVDGLSPLTIPYPDDPRVQFAIDADARLHVLRLEVDERPDALAALTAAGAWAARHLALINMAIAPVGPLRADAAPALHLFTRRPKAVRTLLDADIRLHALAPVRPDHAWVGLDLN